MIPQNIVELVLETARIEEVIGDFVNLKKSGSSFKGLSPWTQEKTPSFYVVPSKGIFKDFSSGKGGNVASFLMEHEHLSFPDAVRYLAKKYNIEIPEREMTAEEIQEQNSRESLAAIHKFAAGFFKDQLWKADEGKAIGLSYFRERGFRDEIIERFGLGYCPEKGNAFTEAALAAGYKLEYLEESGLTKTRENRHFDFFHGRVIFPIKSQSGQVVAFGARTLRKDKSVAKYFNSPENELYHKSRVLYGLFEARKSINKEDNCYLVEGYTDVISLHQAGIENVVSSSGTSLTTEQVQLIKRYTRNVTILYDGDPAGIRASFRGIDMILEADMNVRCVLFPDGDDPDSYSKKVDSGEFQAYIQEHAQNFIEFKAAQLVAEAKGDPIKRSEAIREIVRSIALIPDHIARNVYVQTCSRLFEIQEQALINELNKFVRQRLRENAQHKGRQGEEMSAPGLVPSIQDEKVPEADAMLLWKEMLRILLHYGDKGILLKIEDEETEQEIEVEVPLAEYIFHELEQDGLKPPAESKEAKLFQAYQEFVHREELPSDNFFTLHPDITISSFAADLYTHPYQLSENWSVMHKIYVETEERDLKRAADHPIVKLRQYHVLTLSEKIDHELKETEDEQVLARLLEQKMTLNTMKAKIADYFGTSIL